MFKSTIYEPDNFLHINVGQCYEAYVFPFFFFKSFFFFNIHICGDAVNHEFGLSFSHMLLFQLNVTGRRAIPESISHPSPASGLV